jgi:uncharacterized protein YebE (UPF0316 family)
MPWYIPILIFLARICDVSIGTLRTMLVISGHRMLAAMLGAVEVVIWILAIGGAIKYLTEWTAIVGYASGFMVGVLLGMWIEEKLAFGYRVVRIISTNGAVKVCEALREKGYRVTQVAGHGKSGQVEIALLVIRRRRLDGLRKIVREIVPEAFLTVERVEQISGGEFKETRFGQKFASRLMAVRK